MRALVTGCAGFIGSSLCRRMLEDGWEIVGLDNMDPYYDPAEKRANLRPLMDASGFRFLELDITDAGELRGALAPELGPAPDVLFHLAAKVGVRASLADPEGYERVNVEGLSNMLDLVGEVGTARVVFASSSSVYGEGCRMPFSEEETGLRPLSPYGYTKLRGEDLCRSFATDGRSAAVLRFFTVYGPSQRPDMAIRKFMERSLAGEEIEVFGDGRSLRDYTYIGDIVDGIMAAAGARGFGIYNLGSGRPIELREVLEVVARTVGRELRIRRLPPQKADMPATLADISRGRRDLGYSPNTPFEEGCRMEYEWLRDR